LQDAFGSRDIMYLVLTLVILEIVVLLSLIFLPGISMNIFFGLILIGLVHLIYLVSIFAVLIIGFGSLRIRKISALNPFFILVVVAVILFFLDQKAMNLRLWIFHHLYTDIATRVINQEFPIEQSDSPLKNVNLPQKFFLTGYGQNAEIQLAKIEGNSLVFFAQSGFMFEQCGYMFSSMNKMPDVSVFDFGWGARGRFDSISHNWFYGCIKYD
jgi:hypothetical protein